MQSNDRFAYEYHRPSSLRLLTFSAGEIPRLKKQTDTDNPST